MSEAVVRTDAVKPSSVWGQTQEAAVLMGQRIKAAQFSGVIYCKCHNFTSKMKSRDNESLCLMKIWRGFLFPSRKLFLGFLCQQDYAKTTKRISTNLGGRKLHVLKKGFIQLKYRSGLKGGSRILFLSPSLTLQGVFLTVSQISMGRMNSIECHGF